MFKTEEEEKENMEPANSFKVVGVMFRLTDEEDHFRGHILDELQRGFM